MSVSTLQTVKKDITFRSGASKLAANLYVPPGFDEAGSYPSVVFSPPFNQVKEQTGAVYGRHLAKHGYITLVFDHIGYGDSEGAIRNNENAFVKIETIRDAVSFMCTLSYVDRDRLFGLGICASGTYMALVAATDKRLKAIATVSGMMNNQTSYFGSMDRPTITALILAQNAGRQKAYETGEVDYVDALGLSNAEGAPKEGYDYYMTARAGAQTYPNYSHLSPSFMLEAPMIADAQTYAKYLYTPYIGIYGEKANDPDNGPLATASFTINFYNAASEPKELVEIDGASHVSLYDIEQDVCRAVEAMIRFFERHGGKQTQNTT